MTEENFYKKRSIRISKLGATSVKSKKKSIQCSKFHFSVSRRKILFSLEKTLGIFKQGRQQVENQKKERYCFH